jgi:hypothetical protein
MPLIMDVRASTALLNTLTRTGDAGRTQPSTAVQKPVATRPMDEARAAARAAFAKVVPQPTRIDPLKLAQASQPNAAPLPRGSLLNIVV